MGLDIAYNTEFIAKITVKKIFSQIGNRYALSVDIDEYNAEHNFDLPKDFVGYPEDAYRPDSAQAYGTFLSVYEWDSFIAKVKFIENKYGHTLDIIDLPSLLISKETKVITKIAHKQIAGVSEKTMIKIGDTLGSDFISILNDDPDRINEIKGLNNIQKERILDWCDKHRDVEEVTSELLSYGLSAKTIAKIYQDYGSKSLYNINTNPYNLYYYGSASFKDADKLVYYKNIFEVNSLKRLECALYAIVRLAQEEGHMCYQKDLVIDSVNKFIKTNKGFETDYEFSPQTIGKALQELYKNQLLVEYKAVKDGKEIDVLYITDNYIDERQAAEFIANRCNELSYIGQNEDYRNYIENLIINNKKLDEKQKEAVIQSLTHRIAVINGGPGTGKTFTITSIIKTLQDFYQNRLQEDRKFKLMAPTGKAASRISEVTKIPATTIHSAFKLTKEGNVKDESVLTYDWIIIDEASMIDAKLFAYICTHIEDTTNVILCGDSAQLPSVSQGSVLEQIVKGNLITRVELDRIHRQKKKEAEDEYLLDNAFVIRNAAQSKDVSKLQLPYKSKDFSFVEVKDDLSIQKKILTIYKTLIKQGVKPEEILILSPVHKGDVGTNALNKMIQEERLKREIEQIVADKVYKKGDRIIQLENNHREDMFNGDVGYITAINKNEYGIAESITVQFDDKDRDNVIGDLENIDLAYALTVHKSQGSEAKYVIMPFSTSRSHVFMLTNKLIYTGITRAKTMFIGVGDKQQFIKGCLANERTSRNSLLSYMTHSLINE